MNKQIAKTILQQIGNKALYMMGAKNISYTKNAVQFFIRGCRKINLITIKLNANDTYEITFAKFSKPFSLVDIDIKKDIYCDQLKPIIEKTTGLYLSL